MSGVALVINCSAPSYNLGAGKLVDWLRSTGWEAQYREYDRRILRYGANLVGKPDLVCLSVIFSWHAPIARDLALRLGADADVWCGGPGISALGSWWNRETGRNATIGLDQRFDRQRGDYRMTFATRGCPVGCSFCIVPRIEGREITVNPDFQPAPILCDNNLSAVADEWQRFILARYEASGVELLDCNSGFEPRTFGRDTYNRWAGKFKGPWRFAFDEQREAGDVARMMRILGDERPRKKQVYVLSGNEPVEAVYERAQCVIEWGGEPYVQTRMKLNVLSRDDLWLSHDWTPTLARDFQRYYARHLWRNHPIWEYKPRVNEPEPFAFLAPKVFAFPTTEAVA